MHWILYLGIALFSATGSALAQSDTDVRVDLEMPYDTIGIGEVVQISLVFHNTKPMGDVQRPTVPGLEWLPGTSTAQSMHYINGVQTSSVTYHYAAKATQLGLIILPSFETETAEGYFTTPELVAVVVPETPYRLQQEHHNRFEPSPFARDPFFQQRAPFGQMDERMNQLRKELEERQQQQLKELERYRKKAPTKKSKKQRKTYRI